MSCMQIRKEKKQNVLTSSYNKAAQFFQTITYKCHMRHCCCRICPCNQPINFPCSCFWSKIISEDKTTNYKAHTKHYTAVPCIVSFQRCSGFDSIQWNTIKLFYYYWMFFLCISWCYCIIVICKLFWHFVRNVVCLLSFWYERLPCHSIAAAAIEIEKWPSLYNKMNMNSNFFYKVFFRIIIIPTLSLFLSRSLYFSARVQFCTPLSAFTSIIISCLFVNSFYIVELFLNSLKSSRRSFRVCLLFFSHFTPIHSLLFYSSFVHSVIPIKIFVINTGIFLIYASDCNFDYAIVILERSANQIYNFVAQP